ncbi:hypothetical protein T484DRAFT_1808249, partial [Baffinella frigidus]
KLLGSFRVKQKANRVKIPESGPEELSSVDGGVKGQAFRVKISESGLLSSVDASDLRGEEEVPRTTAAANQGASANQVQPATDSGVNSGPGVAADSGPGVDVVSSLPPSLPLPLSAADGVTSTEAGPAPGREGGAGSDSDAERRDASASEKEASEKEAEKEAENAALKGEVGRLSEENTRLAAANQDLEEERKAWLAQRQQLEASRASVERLRAANTDVGQMLGSTNKALRAANEDVERLRAANKALEEQRDQARPAPALAQKQQLGADHPTQLSELNKMFKALWQQVGPLQEAYRHEVNELQRFKALEAEQQSMRDQLRTSKAQLQAELQAAKTSGVEKFTLAEKALAACKAELQGQVALLSAQSAKAAARAAGETKRAQLHSALQGRADALQHQLTAQEARLTQKEARRLELEGTVQRLVAERTRQDALRDAFVAACAQR